MECNTRMCENGETKAHDVDEICLKHMAHLWHHSKNTSWLGYHGIPWTSDGPRSNATLLFTASVQDPGSPNWVFGPPDVGHFHRPKVPACCKFGITGTTGAPHVFLLGDSLRPTDRPSQLMSWFHSNMIFFGASDSPSEWYMYLYVPKKDTSLSIGIRVMMDAERNSRKNTIPQENIQHLSISHALSRVCFLPNISVCLRLYSTRVIDWNSMKPYEAIMARWTNIQCPWESCDPSWSWNPLAPIDPSYLASVSGTVPVSVDPWPLRSACVLTIAERCEKNNANDFANALNNYYIYICFRLPMNVPQNYIRSGAVSPHVCRE